MIGDTKTMKIAVVTNTISHFEVPLYRMCAIQKDFVFRVYYLTKIPLSHEWYDSQYQSTINWGENLLGGYDANECANIGELIRRVHFWQPDVVLMYGYSWPGAIRLILRNKQRRIPQVHRGTLSYYRDPRRRIRSFFVRPIRNHILRLFDSHHSGGAYSYRALQEAGVSEESVFFVPYSVDTDFFSRNATILRNDAQRLKGDLGWENKDRILLYIGQHNWFKGPDLIMKIFRSVLNTIPHTCALIVGNGKMTDSMKSYAAKNLPKNRCKFVGFVSSKDTVKYYLASDIVLFTSRYETWGRAINEAMLCSRVCIINRRIPAAGGLVDHGVNGFVVDDYCRIEDYFNYVRTFFNLSNTQKNRMMNNAAKKARSYSYGNYIENVIASFEYAIHSHNSTIAK